jgi:hypothetical protein
MNAVAMDDALAYLGMEDRELLTPIEERQARAKKRKIVTSSKKMERRMSRTLMRRVDSLI